MEQLIDAAKVNGYYGPVVDGLTLPRHPFHPDAPEFSAHIPFLVHTNYDESRLLIGIYKPEMFDLTWKNLKENLNLYSEKMGNLDLDEVITLYRDLYPGFSASDVFFRATTDSRDWRPALVEIERRAALPPGAAPTYSSELRWGSPVDGGKYKAHHALDISLTFDNVDHSNRWTGTNPDAYELAEMMSETFIAFAKTGNPDNHTIPHWPPYDLEKRSTLVFDRIPWVIHDPRKDERELFSTVPYENPGT
jgi:para-nitrobenzyl esterase